MVKPNFSPISTSLRIHAVDMVLYIGPGHPKYETL
jgi:hypothetical protein